jgi:hypothetical protein
MFGHLVLSTAREPGNMPNPGYVRSTPLSGRNRAIGTPNGGQVRLGRRAGTDARVTDETADRLPTVRDLDELVPLVGAGDDLYIRWSRGPEHDSSKTSRDELTGVHLPGLSASPLRVEPWWQDRSLRTWVARRLYDYRHLEGQRGPGVRPWLLEGREVGRGPDNEPLVECRRPIAWLSDSVVEEATQEIDAQSSSWGSLNRRD